MNDLAHDWDVSPKEAIEIQRRLREAIVLDDAFDAPLRRVAGIDVGFEDHGRITCAAVVVLSFPELKPLEQTVARLATRFPYVPGLLSFRETPAVLDALAALVRAPDLLLCDGQGYAHPRRFGLACHVGLLAGIPSIGIAKKRLIGTHASVPDIRGSWSELLDDGDIIGAVLRSRAGVKPVYVSTGHRVSLATAVDLTLACTTRFRLPEPSRRAHRLASGRRERA
jgi:deoxyribonuclease V